MSNRRSTYNILGWPESFGASLATLALVLSVSPYFSDVDFGFFKVPTLPANLHGTLRWVGPCGLIVALILFFPLWPRREAHSPKHYNEDQRRAYSELWEQVLKVVSNASRNSAQVTYDDREKGAAHHDRLAESGSELVDPGVWTRARGAAWKKLFFDDRIELEKMFRIVLTSSET